VTIYSTASFDIFKKYLFYTNNYNKDTANQITKDLNNEKYSFGNVTFISCNTPLTKENKDNLQIVDVKCAEEKINLPHLSIARLKDGGETFKLFNDKLCKGVSLNRYASNMKISDFKIEGLSNEKFCQTYITSL